MVGALSPFALPLGGIAVFGVGAALALKGGAVFKVWSDMHRVTLRVRDDHGAVLPLTHRDARCAALVPTAGYEGWHLTLPYRQGNSSNIAQAVLTGDHANRALATLLPHLNRGGGTAREVREATDVIGASRTMQQILHGASVSTEAGRALYKNRRGESNVGVIPTPLRLALEMVLHEDDERRAMEGELHLLEQRWRDAEEIAAIADSLLLPPGVEDELSALRQRAGTER